MKDAHKPQNAGKKSQTKQPEKKIGRPSDFSEKIATIICARLADGESLRSVCRDPSLPHVSTVLRWVGNNQSFREQYTHAREAGLEQMADEIIEIADAPVGSNDSGSTDAGAVNKQRLQVDARKWILSKQLPKKYGDKQTVEHEGGVQLNVVTGIPSDDN